MSLLGHPLTMAEIKYSKFVKVGNSVSQSCLEAAEDCACTQRMLQDWERAISIGGTLAKGVALLAVAGAFTFGLAAIVGLGITAMVVALMVCSAIAGVLTAVVNTALPKSIRRVRLHSG